MKTQAVVDHNLFIVRQLHVGEVGSMNDKRVFRRSPLCHDLLQDENEQLLSGDEHLLGDGGYALTDFMMIPFINNGHLTPSQVNFNKTLSQCRVRVENAFGRAKGIWRRIKFLHARNRAIVSDHITSSFVLHNFILLNGENVWEDGELERPIHPNQVLGNVNVEDDLDDPEDPILQDPVYLADDQLLHAAEARGVEKRNFIMDYMLQNNEEEDDE